MNKWILSGLAALLALPLVSGELLTNGSFEEAGINSAVARKWQGVGQRKDQPEAKDGRFFIRCIKSPEVQGNADAISAPFAVIPGTNCQIKGFHRGAEGYLFMMWKNADGKSLEPKMLVAPTAKDWKAFGFTVTVPETAVKATLLLRSFDKTTGSDFDLVSIQGESQKAEEKSVKGIQLTFGATPSQEELTARRELAEYLDKVLLDSLEIDGKIIREIRLESSRDGYLPEEWSIESDGDVLKISGSPERGVLYGVYHFLEDQLGIHWWTPQEEFVPAAANVRLSKLALRGKPKMMYRDIYRNMEPLDGGRFVARNRINRDGDRTIEAEYGGAFTYGAPYHCHTFDHYVPAAKYLKSNPEFFSLRNGERLGGQYIGQLCFTNQDLRKLMKKQLRQNIENGMISADSSGRRAPRLYDISINDNWNSCHCPDCLVVIEKYGESGALLLFINDLADSIRADFPDVFITTLAYFHTEPPPTGGVKPADNVIVKFCDTTTNQAADQESPENRPFGDMLLAWSKITDNMFIWDYGITYNFTTLPYPSEMTYGSLHKFYTDNHVTGLFWEHENPELADLYAMKIWLEAKLMENPDTDIEKLRQTFLQGYYGTAAPQIDRYRQLLQTAAVKNQARIDWFALVDRFKYVDLETLLACHQEMDLAEKSVEADAEKLARVRRARVGLDTLTGRLIRHYTQLYHQTNPGKTFLVDRKKLVARLQESWTQESKKYQNPEKILTAINQEINSVEMLPDTYTPPAKFAGKRYYDYTPEDFKISASPAMRLVADPKAENGYAVQVEVDKHPNFYKLPMEMGLYETQLAKTLQKKTLTTVPADGEYHWFLIGKDKVNRKCYVYLTRSWQIQAKLDFLPVPEAEVEVWARLRFAGKDFNPDSTEPGFIFVDRITLVE